MLGFYVGFVVMWFQTAGWDLYRYYKKIKPA